MKTSSAIREPSAPTLPRQTYRAFGLVLASEIPLPELTPATDGGEPDLYILYGSGNPLPTRDEGVTARFAADGDHFLAWPDVAAFRFRGASCIEVEPYPDTPVAYLPFPLLGPIMALALHARGRLTLHASAIDVDGRGVAFVGDKLAGKSTTAAAFLRAGHRLLTDDLLAIGQEERGVPTILPAFGQVKLAEDAAAAVRIASSEPLPLVYPGFQKRQHRLTDPFLHDHLPADRLYVLERGGDRPRVTPLEGFAAVAAVMRYSYITRFGKAALTPAAEARHLQQCAALARAVRVAVLHVPHDLSRLEETVALVAADGATTI